MANESRTKRTTTVIIPDPASFRREDGATVQQPIQPISIEPAPAQIEGGEFAAQERS
ncbi:MAG: hypothetical protein HY651_12405 [Acidobacteria bacterium]|nr:hypothetical protein [Acidobacteriota bacterium]